MKSARAWAEEQREVLRPSLEAADREAARLEALGDRAGAGAVRWAVMMDRQRAKLLEILILAESA